MRGRQNAGSGGWRGGEDVKKGGGGENEEGEMLIKGMERETGEGAEEAGDGTANVRDRSNAYRNDLKFISTTTTKCSFRRSTGP